MMHPIDRQRVPSPASVLRPCVSMVHFAAVGILLAASAAPANGKTLPEALAKAYSLNPVLNAARANQLAVDEDVAVRRASGLPALDITSTFSENVLIPGGQFVVIPRTLQTQAQLSVPVYLGGQVRNGMKAADARVKAGAEQLRATETSVFADVVAAYNDVLRDTEILGFNLVNAANLEVNLKAVEDRYTAGELTVTDVAQSEARLAQARAQLQTAEANLVASMERYVQHVGEPPSDLTEPPPLPGLPASLDEALSVALEYNPDLLAAARTSDAAGFDVKTQRASRLPRLSAFGTFTRNDNFGAARSPVPINIPATQENAVAGARIQIPLFQGGLPAAQIRQAQARFAGALETKTAIERQVVQQVRSAYAAWKASLDVIKAAEAAIAANTVALEGARSESKVGNRTIIELLNAEQELTNTRVVLATARRNAYVSAFTLLVAMGRAQARDLDLPGIKIYDPSENYERVQHSYMDWSDREAPPVRSSRTVSIPAQRPDMIRKGTVTDPPDTSVKEQ